MALLLAFFHNLYAVTLIQPSLLLGSPEYYSVLANLDLDFYFDKSTNCLVIL